jgi:putative PIN family toxin of toxin-antitoxin system
LLLAEAIMVPGSREVSVTRDPSDDKIISVALESGADYIVTGDKVLLTIGEYQGAAIISPAHFMAAMSG